jgi:hypothetical protein
LEALLINKKTLKVPKNPRKYNVWDSSYLNSMTEKCAQIVANIDSMADKEGLYPNELGSIEFPVELIYEVCESYVIMYEKLLKENLLITANPQTNPNIH